MNRLNFSGSYYEIGQKWGKMIKDFYQLPVASKGTIQFAQECKEIIGDYAPGINDFLDGMTEAAGFDAEMLDAFVLALGKEMVDQTREMMKNGMDIGCTAFAISSDHTEEGKTVFSRNYDWLESFAPFFTVLSFQPNNGYKSLSFTDHLIGCYGGLNEEGLGMCIHALPDINPWTPGIRMNVLTRWILDNFNKVEQAVDFIEKVPHICDHNYLLADKHDNIAKIELGNKELDIEYAKNGILITTNHYQSERMKKYQLNDLIVKNSMKRLDNVKNWYKSQRNLIEIEDIKELLKNHGKDGVCNHFEFGGEKTSTIWSWIATLNTGDVLVAGGSPCKTHYEPFDV